MLTIKQLKDLENCISGMEDILHSAPTYNSPDAKDIEGSLMIMKNKVKYYLTNYDALYSQVQERLGKEKLQNGSKSKFI